MGKKKNAKYPDVDPQFQKAIKERYGQPVDLSDGPDHMKMSAKLIALAEPLHDGELDYPILYDCAAIAWNECLDRILAKPPGLLRVIGCSEALCGLLMLCLSRRRPGKR